MPLPQRAILILALLSLAFAPNGHSKDTAIIATYNVRNYLSMDRNADGKWRKDYPKPESEKTIVRESIHSVAPDFLALQEIGSRMHLQELQRDLENEGLRYAHRAWMTGNDETRHVAALWNFPFDYEAIEHNDLWITYYGKRITVKRALLEIRFGDEWSIFIAHLKSKYTDNRDDPLSKDRRAKEARAVRDRIIDLLDKGEVKRFFLLGDMNDSTRSSALNGLRKRGDRQVMRDLRTFDESNLAWTHFYKREEQYSRIDYILASSNWKSMLQLTGKIHHRNDFYTGSDHRLVWVAIPTTDLN